METHFETPMASLNDNRDLISRVRLLKFFVYACILILACQLWRLQIMHGEEYQQLATRNHNRVMPITAPRGIIRDREGRPLASNRPAFNIVLLRENLTDLNSTLDFIEGKLHVNKEDLLDRLSTFKQIPLYKPITIKEDVSWMDLGTVEAHIREHPELSVTQEPRRFYPFDSWASHVLGYVGEISRKQLEAGMFLGAQPGDLVGKQGIEHFYNTELTGVDGERKVIVNSVGRIIRIIERKDPVPGREIRLSLDLDLQLVAEMAMEKHVGALVALNPNNGEILAMVSRPAFDPNSFMGRISNDDWHELINNPAAPFMNRATQASYSPGSIFKIIMAFAGLREGIIKPSDWLFCNGRLEMYDHVFHCSHHGGHGFVNVNLAIQSSCNIFFYNLGRKMGIETIGQYARQMGLGRRTHIDLPNERSGVVPSPQWKEEKYGERWYVGETISVSIGQGALLTTPIQLARAVGQIATGGKVILPHLRMEENELATHPANNLDDFNPKHQEILRDAMWRVVNHAGTGRLAAVSGLDVSGKTGTVQLISRAKRVALEITASNTRSKSNLYKDHAWFVGFAPKNAPDIVVAVFVEHGGRGGDPHRRPPRGVDA